MTRAMLKSYRDLKLERDRLGILICNLERTLYAPRPPKLSGMPRGGTGSPTEEAVIRHADLVSQYRRKMGELAKVILTIEKAIDSLPPKERTLIRLYYVEGMTWEEVGAAMDYSWSQVHRIHGRALAALENR